MLDFIEIKNIKMKEGTNNESINSYIFSVLHSKGI